MVPAYSIAVAHLPHLEPHPYNSKTVHLPQSNIAFLERFLTLVLFKSWLSVSLSFPSISHKPSTNICLPPHPSTAMASVNSVCPSILCSHAPSILVTHLNCFSTNLLRSHQHEISIQRGV